jgi:hypothetical protein
MLLRFPADAAQAFHFAQHPRKRQMKGKVETETIVSAVISLKLRMRGDK